MKRFDIEFYTAPNLEGDFAGMEEVDGGEYVLWTDHQNIVDDLEAALEDAQAIADAAREEIEQLKAALVCPEHGADCVGGGPVCKPAQASARHGAAWKDTLTR